MNLSSGNEYLTYIDFTKTYKVDKKRMLHMLCVELWMMTVNELKYEF